MTTFIHCYTRKAFILMVQSLWYIHHVYIYTWRDSPCSPCWLPFVSPLYPLSTYLAPSSCDRNRPPPSQVACKLTPFAPLHPVDPPLQNSQNPANPRLTTTTSGLFWLLVSRTIDMTRQIFTL